MYIKFQDLSFVTNPVKEEFLKAAEEILDKNHFILSEEVGEFERQWAKTIGTKYAVGVSCGADALYLSLLALGVGQGDEVITQANAYNASVTAIIRAGATPRFLDINPGTFEMDVSKLEQAITNKVKALMPVHLYGQANEMEELIHIANQHQLLVIEDCAQAHLAEYKGKKVGSFGTINAFSFYPTKNLGAFGDAGAVTTNNEILHQKILKLRNLGQAAKNDHQLLGFNMRLDPMQAAVLSLKLPFLQKWTEQRQEAAEYYKKLIDESKLKLQYQQTTKDKNNVYHLFVVLLPENTDREKLQKQLLNKGVETAIHYPLPVYRQPFYNGEIPSAPVSDEVAKRILSLPFFVGITKEQQEYVIDSLKNVL